MQDIRKLARIQILTILIFVICKKWLRPIVLQGDNHIAMDITVLSLPNFFEGIIGVLTLTYIGLYLIHHFLKGKKCNITIYLVATLLTAVFVITQEFKVHNLGGNNVYDPWDVVFSIAGLLVGFLIVFKLKPSIHHA